MCQSVGRVLRLHLDDVRRIQQGQLTPGKLEDYKKSFGLVHVPVYSNVGSIYGKKITKCGKHCICRRKTSN